MDFDVETLQILKDPTTSRVFDQIVRSSRVQLGDLVSRFEPDMSSDEIETSIKKLTEAELLEENRATLPEWNTYYVTPKGWQASRKLKR